MTEIDERVINNIRVVSMEMINKAKSGHPGIALGAAPIMHTLYSKVLKQSGNNPHWFNRDRFILAAGHGSSLLYATLHLAGYNISVDDLKNFRQLHSITAGHPELGVIDGVDATSGPLGQGIPMGVGMAISQSFLSNKYNRDGFDIFNGYIYVLCGDGDLQEGITNEALSLVGHLGLNKLIILYDSNDIQLDGEVSNANTEDVKLKMESMHLNYLKVEDGENVDDIYAKINEAKKSDKPSFIEIKTIIGRTSSKANSCDVHGSPLSDEEVEGMRKSIGGESFEFFEETKQVYNDWLNQNNIVYNKEKEKLSLYEKKYPAEYMELSMYLENSDVLEKDQLQMPFDKDYSKATRNAIGEIISKVSELCPVLIGGSADLAKSTYVKGADGSFTKEMPLGRNINFGVREHAMASICNGIALYGITKPFCGGFFVFSDYMKPAIRMSALMGLPVVYCFSHDSIAVGEDGPTHQPIEQLTMLRSIPNLNVIRPSGKEETKESFVIAYNSKHNPTVLVLSRQKMMEIRTKENSLENLTLKGAYIVSAEPGVLQGIILATGSEVELAIKVQHQLETEGFSIRVVSMPSMFLFDKQDDDYKKSVLPDDTYIMALEMSEAAHMYKYVKKGRVYNIKSFGVSGKASDVLEYFGFTVNNVVLVIKEDLK